MVIIVLATSGTLHSLSGGGKVVVRVKYEQRPEKELLKFPEEAVKHFRTLLSYAMGVWYTEMDQAGWFCAIFYFIHIILDVSSINLGMVKRRRVGL